MTLAAAEPAGKEERKPSDAGKPLFDGKTLTGWERVDSNSPDDVVVEEGKLVLVMGHPFTGIRYTGAFPTMNYEVALDAKREAGTDFFCGMTFPVGKDRCSLILGGWGGSVLGLSSLNGFDASENETTLAKRFDNEKWYHVRVRVTPKKIQAWLDDEEIVDVETEDKEIGIRPEMDGYKPFGLASWQTTAAYKNIQVRSLTKADADKPPAKKEK